MPKWDKRIIVEARAHKGTNWEDQRDETIDRVRPRMGETIGLNYRR